MARDILAWRSRDASHPPPLLRIRSSKVFILTTLCIAVFTDLFLYSMIVPVVPFALSSRAGIAEKDVQRWVSVLLAAYGAAMVVFDPICGWFADHCSSRRLPLLLGLLALAGSTLMLCLGTNIIVLIVARILQGMSASAVYTVGLALLVDTVGPNQIAEMIGYVSLSSTAAMLLGPVLGGVIYDKAGYFAVYYLAFGLIFLDIALRTMLIEKKIAKQWDTFEEPIQEINHAAPKEGSQVRSVIASDIETQTPQVNTLTSSKKHLSRTLILLSSRRLLSALFCTVAQSVLMSVWDATLPLRVNKLFGWTSLGASLIFIPFIIPAISAPLIGMYVDKHGPRHPAALGFLLCAIPLALLRLVTHSGIRQIVLLCVLCFMIGLALTIAMVPFLAEITYVVAAKEKAHPSVFGKRGAYAQAFGIHMGAFSAGMLLGPLWGGFVVEHAGWGTLAWSLAVLSAVCVVPAMLWTGGWIAADRDDRERGAEAPITEIAPTQLSNAGKERAASGSGNDLQQ